MGDIQEIYKQSTLSMLAQFQFLEESIKIYISTAYRFISLRLDGDMHFGYSEKDLDSLSLERLLIVFSKLNSNSTLISRMNKLKAQRNHIAHKSLIIATGRYADIKKLRSGMESYATLQPELSSCTEALREESRSLWNRFSRAQQAHYDQLDYRTWIESEGAA